MSIQIVTIEGRAGSDAKLNTNQNGQNILTVNVAVTDPRNKDQTNWYRCSVWGKRAVALEQYIVKGTIIFATGTFSIGEYNGKPQLDVRVNDISFYNNQRHGDAPQRQSQSAPAGRAQPKGYDPDLDDDVPF